MWGEEIMWDEGILRKEEIDREKLGGEGIAWGEGRFSETGSEKIENEMVGEIEKGDIKLEMEYEGK